MPLTAVERGNQAEEILPVAAYLSTLVHGDGGARDIAQALARLGPQQKNALIVVLAALADPDRPLADLLGWLDFDEFAQPATPPAGEESTLRDIAETYPIRTARADIDEVAVRRALDGMHVILAPEERIVAVAEGRRRGMSHEQIAAALHANPAGLARAWERAKAEARNAGEPQPALPVPYSTAA